jgi:hypothetical protein
MKLTPSHHIASDNCRLRALLSHRMHSLLVFLLGFAIAELVVFDWCDVQDIRSLH